MEKLYLLKLFQEWGIKSDGGVNSSMTYLIYCKNFANATMYPHPAQE
jgi:hypothetical protein